MIPRLSILQPSNDVITVREYRYRSDEENAHVHGSDRTEFKLNPWYALLAAPSRRRIPSYHGAWSATNSISGCEPSFCNASIAADMASPEL